jgi:hypothetical protein
MNGGWRMFDSGVGSGLVILFALLLAVVGLAALLLHWRDKVAKSQGKTQEQVRVRFSAILQFRSTLERCIPGLLIIVFGIFYAIDRGRQRQSDWWVGLLFIPAGWVLVSLLARKSWRRYVELQRLAETGEYEYISTDHSPSKSP